MIGPTDLARLEEACRLAEESGRDDLHAAALNNLSLAQRRVGRISESVESGRRALSILEPVGDRHQLAALHSNLADTLHQMGDETGARTASRRLSRLVCLRGPRAGGMGTGGLDALGVVNALLAHMGGIDEIGIFLIPALVAIFTLRWVEKRAKAREAEDPSDLKSDV